VHVEVEHYTRQGHVDHREDLEVGAVEQQLFGWFKGSPHASWNDEEGWGERETERKANRKVSVERPLLG
jgi:hypothetical protein